MKCPRCGSEMKEGMLFCENCGEEIRIVQDFEPEIDGIVTGFDNASNIRPAKVNTEKGKKNEASHMPVLKKRHFGRKKRVFYAAGGAALLIVCVLAAVFVLCFRNSEYQYKRAMRYIQAGDYDVARAYAEQAVRLAPDDSEYLAAYAVCLAQTGRKEETVTVCLRILELDASNEQAYRALIAIYEEDGEYEKINDLLLSCPDEQIVSSYPAYVAKPPEFSYESGIYDEALSLRLSANTSGTIYYTMDGSEPDENSLTYTSPIFLESGAYQIRAVFVNQYGVASQEAEGNYFVDVTVPDAPQVRPEGGSYSRPALITVSGGENCRIFYTTDGSAPTQDNAEYTGPIPMPVGVTKFRFICYSLAGAAGEETQVTYDLNLRASLSIEAARNKLLIELMAADVIQDMSGTVETGTGHYVYNYRYAVTIDGTDYYLYREYYEDDAGNSAATGTDYVVDIMNGTCCKTVQAEPAEGNASLTGENAKAGGTEGEGAAGPDAEPNQAEEAAGDPWSSLTLQEIDAQDENPEADTGETDSDAPGTDAGETPE